MTIEEYINGQGEFMERWRAFVTARLEAMLRAQLAEWEAEEEQAILYGRPGGSKPQGVIYLDAHRRKRNAKRK